MAKMSDEMIVGMIQQHLDCLQRFIKADELSASDWKFMADHAWKIEWDMPSACWKKKKKKKIKTKRASALFIYKEIVWNTILRNL